jgi:FRG domain
MTANSVSLGPVDSVESLRAAIAQVAVLHPGCLLLFRGQNNLHPTLKSGLSRPEIRYHPDVEQGFSAIAGAILGHDSLSSNNVAFRKAVLQHYGFPTNYIDLTSDPEVAAWFATHTAHENIVMYGGWPIRHLDRRSYERRQDGQGYVLVLAIPNAEELKTRRRLFDLANLDPFVRPFRQKAWLIYDRKPLLPDPNGFWVANITVDCTKFVSSLSIREMFPPPTEDKGYAALLSLPFVEVPGTWLPASAEKREAPPIDFGIRAFKIPEYAGMNRKDEYNHKWNDRIHTEPKPMQSWVTWDYDLAGEFPGIQGNIKAATKITISPPASAALFAMPADTPLRWPSLGTDELFFTFAQHGHDKVDDIEYPGIMAAS